VLAGLNAHPEGRVSNDLVIRMDADEENALGRLLGRLTLQNRPAADNFRVVLRVYDFDPPADRRVRVRAFSGWMELCFLRRN
jgi:hypothetical protein